MTVKRLAICVLALCVGGLTALPVLAGDWRHDRDHRMRHSERYVPAGGDIIDYLFGGPRYYDMQMSTTAAGACAYHPVGPDGNAVNDVNDHYCGK
ncbi:hypothetical protein [Mesorhizobium sp. SP-1A]|uniref:hypothetical protein n=1 Tax=Mesorhizobium sp. SP-1A TaxID=3077840 RepID=UPI0028F72086|nr:hypothetical protein [Mesorhizobium sp. SP-1A]